MSGKELVEILNAGASRVYERNEFLDLLARNGYSREQVAKVLDTTRAGDTVVRTLFQIVEAVGDTVVIKMWNKGRPPVRKPVSLSVVRRRRSDGTAEELRVFQVASERMTWSDAGGSPVVDAYPDAPSRGPGRRR